MTSPARRHYLRTAAAQSAAAGAPEPSSQHANAYELMLVQLHEHRRRLKQLQSIERKIEAKRAMLPDYAPWVEGVLKGGRGGQDDVLMTVMVWSIDVGALAEAVVIAEYALTHGLTMPDQYQRDVACLIAEEGAELVLKQVADGTAPSLGPLLVIEELTRDHDMPDEVRAKLFKAIGYALRNVNQQGALDALKRALQLHDKCGVKKDIERLEREIKNAAPPPDKGEG